ncbi:MAG: pyridoxal phosphate-dependent aminotransferase [Lachnospiraceae bacterium]|nr:pyridoxal phosphate-dependent aminotransferase [Lachnospiraceae bacterium]
MISRHIEKALGNSSAIREVCEYSAKLAKEIGDENVFDFSLGNPATKPPKAFDETITAVLQTTDSMKLHGYTDSEGMEEVREAIAKNLSERFGVAFEKQHICVTVGAGGALNVVLRTLLDIDDEVIIFAPYFGEYNHYIDNFYGKAVVVQPDLETFEPDMEDFEKKITERTKAVIVNSPNNPSGVVYKEGTLKAIAEILYKKQSQYGHDIYWISDEPYRELLYDGAVHHCPCKYYDNTFLGYSFSKSLSLPGERIGYVAVSPNMADVAHVALGVKNANRILGFVNAPSLMQLTVAKCLEEETDIEYYNTNRKILYEGLTKLGFTCVKPEGAFYLFLKSPIEDDVKFCKEAMKYHLMMVNGTSFECPGYVRLAYCISTDKVKRSLEQFAKLAKEFDL